MGNLNIEIPDEECVKLFRYEDGDGVARIFCCSRNTT